MQGKRAKLAAACLTAALAGVVATGNSILAQQNPTHKAAKSDGKTLVVQLCDGVTTKEVAGVRPDERLTPEQARTVSNELMAMWLAKQSPETRATWLKEISEAERRTKDAPESRTVGSGQAPQQSDDFSNRDRRLWKEEVDREIAYGDKLFHDDKLIGSSIGVACAMCHPNGSNTHPETYPKYQVQLQRVALLRDMINWCIENPAQGKQLAPDDPKMRALEAYILAQRKGVPMEYGKH
jgi:cytochrome c553